MVDLKMTNDGDLVLSDNGDLAIVYGDEQLAQEILFRMKTQKGDWVLSPDIGVSLERFIGEPNTELTRSAIEMTVLNEITKDGLIISAQVDCVPLNENELLIVVEFPSQENDDRVIQISSGLDLRAGLVFSRINSREI
jgi:hypothetical protein